MRHRRRGRTLGRSPSHRKAMLKNLASALFLTERDASLDENQPKVPGRITTTLHKAKEVRPLVEKCITIAKKSLWAAARAPVVAARRRVVQLIGDKEAARVLFDVIAERYADRPGGYTRVLRLATPRLGDAGERAILELVGKHDRIKRKAERPAFDEPAPEDESPQDEPQSETPRSETDDESLASTEAEPAAATSDGGEDDSKKD